MLVVFLFSFRVAREVVSQLDKAQEFRNLKVEEVELCKKLKLKSLVLASLARTVARQRSRLLFISEGGANIKIFHLQSCHRQRSNIAARRIGWGSSRAQ